MLRDCLRTHKKCFSVRLDFAYFAGDCKSQNYLPLICIIYILSRIVIAKELNKRKHNKAWQEVC